MREIAEPRRTAKGRAIEQAANLELARRAAARWGAPAEAMPRRIHSVQNFVFAVNLPEPAILRLTHRSHRRRKEIEAELRWINDLLARKLPVARPLPSAAGQLVESLGDFSASCFERLPGFAPNPSDPKRWNARMFEQLGKAIGQLHSAAIDAGWNERRLARPSWRGESVARNFHSLIPDPENAIHRAFDRLLAQLEALPRTPTSYGLIHADLNHANFFVARDGLKIFDFDDSCFSWFAYDLIVSLYHLPPAQLNTLSVLKLLIRGYERVRPFDQCWLEWLPLFFKWRDFITYAFFHEQLEIESLPRNLRDTFLAMRARLEADRPIAEIRSAG